MVRRKFNHGHKLTGLTAREKEACRELLRQTRSRQLPLKDVAMALQMGRALKRYRQRSLKRKQQERPLTWEGITIRALSHPERGTSH